MNTQWIKPALGGLAVGVVGTAIIGFTTLDWVGPETADEMAATRAEAAVVAVLTPLCVDQARLASAEARAEVVDANYYSRGDMVEAAGWASAASEEYLSEVSDACAQKIVAGIDKSAG